MPATTHLSQGPFLWLLAAFALFAYPVFGYWALNTMGVALPNYQKQVYIQVYGSGPTLVAIGLVGLNFHRPILGMGSLGLGICWLGAILYELLTKV